MYLGNHVECTLRECGTGPVLQAIQFLYDQSKRFLHILDRTSNTSSICVGRRKGCNYLPILFVIFVYRI